MTWDWNEEKTYDLVPEGVYTVTLVTATLDEEKTVPRLNVQYKLENNRRVFQSFSFDEKGNKWVTWQFGVLHLNTKAKALLKDPSAATNVDIARVYTAALMELVNTKMTVEVTHTEWQGKAKEKVTLVDSSSSPIAFTNSVMTTPAGVSTSEPLPF